MVSGTPRCCGVDGQPLRPRRLNRDAPIRIKPADTSPIAARSPASGTVVPALGNVPR